MESVDQRRDPGERGDRVTETREVVRSGVGGES